MSWESSAEYYRLVNEEARRRLGGLHSARSLMLSVDFAGMEELQREGRWEEAAAQLAEAARSLERGGADFVVLCTNTMHRVADEVARAVEIPLLHIADATAARLADAGVRRVGLLGTRYTMEHDFYRGRLEQRHGLDVLVPDDGDRALVHDVIYEELCLGRIEPRSRDAYRRVIAGLAEAGARGADPRLHGDHAADRPRGRTRAGLRHDADPRGGRGGAGTDRLAVLGATRPAEKGPHRLPRRSRSVAARPPPR